MPCNLVYLRGAAHDAEKDNKKTRLFTNVTYDETGEDVLLHVYIAIRLSAAEKNHFYPRPYQKLAVEAFNLEGVTIRNDEFSMDFNGQVPFTIPQENLPPKSRLIKQAISS